MRQALALTILPTLATAQILPTGSPAADILLTRALAEQRVFLTCSALDAAPHGFIVAGWEKDAAAAVAILAEHGVAPEAVAAFTAAAQVAALMLAEGVPFSDAKALCDANADWAERYGRLDFIILDLALPTALD
jgi:hypothetical protein